jgi:lipooligosaccharide galactosyltransferase I
MNNAYNLPPIFVISLKDSSRREFIEKRLRGLGLQFEFFDAVYGKNLSQDELQKIDYKFYQSKYLAKKPLTLGEIGCAMSHIKLYEHIREINIPEAIILEDDAIVSHHFKEIVLDALKKAPSRKEIIFLDHGKAKSWLLKKMLFDRYKLVRYRVPSKNSLRGIFMADAYLITSNGINKLLKYAYPIRMPADYLTGMLQMNHINAYGIEPPCVFRGIESEIDQIEDRHNK